MSGLPLLIVAYFFGVVSWAAAHWFVVVPAMVAAWLLLLVPSSTWARARAAVTRREPASATVPVRRRRELQLTH